MTIAGSIVLVRPAIGRGRRVRVCSARLGSEGVPDVSGSSRPAQLVVERREKHRVQLPAEVVNRHLHGERVPGRPGLDPDTAGYRPSQEDIVEFQKQLREVIKQSGL